MARISAILETCEVGDSLTNGTLKWKVSHRYLEDGKLIVIALPDEANTDKFELWSCGVEDYAYMPGLKKCN